MAKVYVSSTIADLKNERKAVMDWLVADQHQPVHSYRPDSDTVRESCLDDINDCDLYVLILGFRYGFQPEGSNPDNLSITHLEFRRAGELCRPRIALMSTAIPDINLSDMLNPQRARLVETFREEVRSKVRIAEFHDEASLIQGLSTGVHSELVKLQDRFPQIEPGTPIAELIVEMMPDIRYCLQMVTLVVNCKRIHDCLHELLQKVFRPLQEEVLSKWNQEEMLSRSRERAIWEFLIKAKEQMGKINLIRRQIDSAKHDTLCKSVDKAIEMIEKWVENLKLADPWPIKEVFSESVDNLTHYVEVAFSEADRSMTKEEINLSERYLALNKGLERTQKQKHLSLSDHQRMDEELRKIDANRESVKDALETHHEWQRAHDELRFLDSCRDSNIFQKELGRRCDTLLPKLRNLVNKGLSDAHTYQARSTEIDEVFLVPDNLQVTPPLPLSSKACSSFIDDMHRLKNALDAIGSGGGEVAFDEMRNPFENAFYCIDKRTLDEVSLAGKRVDSLNEWLDRLAVCRKKSD